jgi:hypothetical protein
VESGVHVIADIDVTVSSGLWVDGVSGTHVFVESGSFVNISGQYVMADVEVAVSSGLWVVTSGQGVQVQSGVFIASGINVAGSVTVSSGLHVYISGQHMYQESGSFTANAIVDNNGVPQGTKFVDGKPRVSAMPYNYDIAEGNISGHRSWSKIGWNPGIGLVEEDIIPQGGLYVWPTTPQRMMTKSAATGDRLTAPVGSGAWTLTLYYLDSGYFEKTETITMNGTSGVNTTAADIYRVNNLRVASVGGAGNTLGNISLTDLSGTLTYGYISSGYTRQRQIIYTVPASGTLYINAYNISANTVKEKATKFTTRANYDERAQTYTSGFWMAYHEIITVDTPWHQELLLPTKLIQKVDLKVSAIAEAVGTATCALRGWLE